LGSGTLSPQHFKVDLTNWKDRYSIFPPWLYVLIESRLHDQRFTKWILSCRAQDLSKEGEGQVLILSFLDFMH
jgi:hypothetical protein